MTSFVLHNSVTMRWCCKGTDTAYSEDVLSRLASGNHAVAPMLWLYEVGPVLAKEQRRGALTAQKAAELIQAIGSLPITIDANGPNHILTDVHRLAVAHRLAGDDAAYLELTPRGNLPLATLDEALRCAYLNAGGSRR